MNHIAENSDNRGGWHDDGWTEKGECSGYGRMTNLKVLHYLKENAGCCKLNDSSMQEEWVCITEISNFCNDNPFAGTLKKQVAEQIC